MSNCSQEMSKCIQEMSKCSQDISIFIEDLSRIQSFLKPKVKLYKKQELHFHAKKTELPISLMNIDFPTHHNDPLLLNHNTPTTTWASLRFEKRLNLSINPRKLQIFYRNILNRSEALPPSYLFVETVPNLARKVA